MEVYLRRKGVRINEYGDINLYARIYGFMYVFGIFFLIPPPFIYLSSFICHCHFIIWVTLLRMFVY